MDLSDLCYSMSLCLLSNSAQIVAAAAATSMTMVGNCRENRKGGVSRKKNRTKEQTHGNKIETEKLAGKRKMRGRTETENIPSLSSSRVRWQSKNKNKIKKTTTEGFGKGDFGSLV